MEAIKLQESQELIQMKNWLENTENTLEEILSGEIEEIFNNAGMYYRQIDEIYNLTIELQEMVSSLKTEILQKPIKNRKYQ